MQSTLFAQRFEADLNKLKEEITSYTDESLVWKTPEGISNSAGTLCLHLVGNINHFIGATLGNSGYVRDRDREFSDKNIPKKELAQRIDETISVVKKILANLSDADLEKTYPLQFQGKDVTTSYLLIFIYGHFNYHLGQINYHRRLIK